MHQPVTRSAQLWEPSSPNVDLESLVDELRLGQSHIPVLPPLHKFVLLDPVLQVLVRLPLVGDGIVRQGILADVATGRVVVAGPDPVVIGQTEEFASRVIEVAGVASGKVATRRPDVDVEERVSAEDVACLMFSNWIRKDV